MSDEILQDVSNVKKSSDLNKAAAIRKAFEILGECKHQDVVDYLSSQYEIEVSLNYVGVIKTQMSKKANFQSFETLRIARKLVKEAGDVVAARLALDALEEEFERTRSLRARYSGQSDEIDARLEDESRPLDQKEKRELQAEKKRIQRLVQALEEFA